MTGHKPTSAGRLFLLVPALAVCFSVLNGCGNGSTPTAVDDTSTPATMQKTGTAATMQKTGTPPIIYLSYEVDGSLSDSAITETMVKLEDVIRKRAEGFGAEVTDVKRPKPNELAVDVSGMTLDEADELFAHTALMDFREPMRDAAGDIVCEDAAGQRFTVPADTGPDQNGDPRSIYIVADSHGDMTGCQGPADTAPRGTVVWTQARGVGSDGTEKALTSHFLQPSSEVIFDQLGRPLLRVRFDAEGTSLFDQITARLVGFPVAICLDGEIISAPIVRTRIERGIAVIEGLTEGEGSMLAIQLNSGALPDLAHIRGVGERWQP